MQAFSEWIRQLGFLILLAGLAEFVLPGGSVRKAARFVIGLVVLLAVVEPVVDIVAEPDWIDALYEQLARIEGVAPLAAGAGIAERAAAAAEEMWIDRLERDLALFLTLMDGIDDAAAAVRPVTGSGRLRVDLTLSGPGGEAARPEERRRKEAEVERLVRRLMEPAAVGEVVIVWAE